MCDMKCPWLGFKPYGEKDAPFFNGRSKAISALLDIVEAKTITVCYAESGIGKTSLINAGLVPIMREKKFFPIWLRFDIKNYEGKTKEEIKEQLRNHILAVFQGAKEEFEKEKLPYRLIWDLPNENQGVTLLDLWKALRVSPKVAVSFNDREYYNVYKPFLILDQFEQMLYDSNSQMVIESFFELLKALVLNDTFSDEYIRMKEKEVVKDGEDPFKVLVSLRQEYIGVLDYWCMTRVPMPSLHDNRYSLQPLTTHEAREVVLPKGYDIFEDAVDQIIEIAKENNAVSSILLSVICRRLYEQTPTKGGKKEKVSEGEVEKKKESIIKDYYDEQLKNAQTGNESLLSDDIIAQIEDALVSDDGKRSLLPIKYGRLQGIEFSEDIKLLLENNGIVRSDKIGENTFVELIHDRVAIAVLERKKERKNRKNREERRNSNYRRFISRQNPLTLGGRRIWDNKTFSFSEDNSRGNSLYNSSNRKEALGDFLQQRKNDDSGAEQLFFDKLFRQTSNAGKITLDFNDSVSRDGISIFNIETEQIFKSPKVRVISSADSKNNPFSSSEGILGENGAFKNDAEQVINKIKIKKIIFTDSKNNPFYTAEGFYGIKSDYDKETGNEIRREYLCDGYTSVGIVAIKFEYDKNGFPVRAMYYDDKDNPRKHIDGNYGVKIEYDDCGNETCRWFLDKEGKIAPIYNGVCGLVSIYDGQDRIIKQYFIDNNNKRIYDNFGYHGVMFNYQEASNEFLVSETVFIDTRDSFVNNPQNYCIEKLQYDDNGREITQLYYDNHRKEVERKDGTCGYYMLNIDYDELDRVGKIKMYSFSSRVIKENKYAYNPNGTISECSYYELINTQEGGKERKTRSDENYAHLIKIGHNKHGVLEYQKFFDENEKTINNKENNSKICFSYDSSGNLIEYLCYRLDNSEKDPVLKTTYSYKNDGSCEITYSEFEIISKEIKTGIKRIDKIINNRNKEEYKRTILKDEVIRKGILNNRFWLVKEFVDENNDYIPGTPLTIRWSYDNEGNIVEVLFYDRADISPICDKEGDYGWKVEYDKTTGEECKRQYLGRTNHRGEYEYYVKTIIFTENHNGEKYIITYHYGDHNEPRLCEEGYHKKIETEFLYGDDDLSQKIQFLDCDEKPCNCKDGYSKQVFEEEQINENEIKRTVSFWGYDDTRKINNGRGYHKRVQIISLDKNMELCRSFMDENDRLINNRNGFAKQTCKRNDSIWTQFHYPFKDHDVIRFYDNNDQKVNVDYEIDGVKYHAYKIVVPLNWSSFIKVSNVDGKTLYRDKSLFWRCINIIWIPIIIVTVFPIYAFCEFFKKLFTEYISSKTNNELTCPIIRVAQVNDEVPQGNGSIVAPAKIMGFTEGYWIVKWNDWVYNKYDPNIGDKFETVLNTSNNRKTITVYDPIEKRFFTRNFTEKNLGLRIKEVQVSEKTVREMMDNALLLTIEDNADFLRVIYSNFARQYKENGEYDKAEEYYRKQIAIMEQQVDATSRHNLADAYDDLGVCLSLLESNNEAVETLERALEICGESEEETQLSAAIHDHLAQVFRTVSEFDKAEFHYKECVKRLEKIDSIPSEIIVDHLMDVGMMLARQEKYDECIEVTERALTMTTEDNLNLLRSIHSNLAYLYKEKGEFGKAEEHYRERITIMKRQGNETSPHDLADAYDDLGVCLFLLDKNEEAIKKLERALDILKESKGENQLIAAIHNHLAQVFRENEDFGRAEFHYKENIKYLKNLEGVSNDVIADILTKVGVMLVRQEKYDEAIDVTERALSLTSNENAGLLQSIHANLAFHYKKKGDYNMAEGHYRDQIAIMEKRGEMVPLHDLADAYDDLGICLFLLDKNSEAIEVLEQALVIVGDSEGENQLIATIHNHLAQVLSHNKEFEKAEFHYKECVRQTECIDTISGDVLAERLLDVGMMLYKQEKFDECLDVTERALSLTSNENIALLTSIHSNLASLYNKKSEYEKAENHYRERISLIEKDGDANYHYLAIAYDDLGVCLHQLNKNDEAVDNLEHALSMVETDENEAQLIAQIHQHLSQVYSAVGASEKANLHNSKYLELMKLLDENCGTDIKPIEK